MSEFKITEYEGFDEAKARGWYQMWRREVHNWVKRHANSDYADLLLLLPDLFILCAGLIRDPRLPSKFKLALVSAAAYVLSPFDLLPEAVFSVAGLIDDAGILIIALDTVFSAMQIDPGEFETILREHWHGGENPVQVVKTLNKFVFANGSKLFGRLWGAISRFVAPPPASDSQPNTGNIAITS